MPSLLRYAQGCGVFHGDTAIPFLVAYKSLPLESLCGGSYISSSFEVQNLISFFNSFRSFHVIWFDCGTESDRLRSETETVMV